VRISSFQRLDSTVTYCLRHHAPGRGSVTDTALACGFEHFGRFSEAYRKLFGERPSQTLRSSALSR
jgi:AraC-like DNA-binding protein